MGPGWGRMWVCRGWVGAQFSVKHGGHKAWRMAVSRKADPLEAEPCAPLPALTPTPNPQGNSTYCLLGHTVLLRFPVSAVGGAVSPHTAGKLRTDGWEP